MAQATLISDRSNRMFRDWQVRMLRPKFGEVAFGGDLVEVVHRQGAHQSLGSLGSEQLIETSVEVVAGSSEMATPRLCPMGATLSRGLDGSTAHRVWSRGSKCQVPGRKRPLVFDLQRSEQDGGVH